jgi:hypothetical protein
MANALRHIPIFSVDVQGFTTHNTATQRTIVRRLQNIATEAARFFMPFGDPWAKWRRHGTGDGYYFVFDGLSPQIALQYAINLDAGLVAHNAQHGQELTLRLYGALVIGDVELVQDQYLSEAFSEAARFLSYQSFKDYLAHQDHPMVLAMSALFHTEWHEEIQRDNRFLETAALRWTAFSFHDKHEYLHKGYVLGPGWEQEPDVTRADPRPGPVDEGTARRPESAVTTASQMSVAGTARYTGEDKINVCRRLVSDWQELADYFDIPPYERARFDRGRESYGVWEWLEVRGRLADLAKGLAAIGRRDLLEFLQPRPR